MRLDVSTVLIQWSTGGLLFCWVTTRRRDVGLGYGWLLRATYGVLAAGGALVGITGDETGTGAILRDLGGVGAALAAAVALVVSVVRRRAGVRGQRAERARRRARVETMLDAATGPSGGERRSLASERATAGQVSRPAASERDREAREFPPGLDLLAPALGLVALVGGAAAAGGPYPLSLVRLTAGALLLGAVTDAMLLGHWYLVQPGLGRGPIRELVIVTACVWPFEVAALLWPEGMVHVLDGTIDDGWDGLLGWTWALSAASTIVLVGVTWLALRERAYSAVMAATGLLYLAILMAFGTDLVARAVLSP